MSTNVLRGNWFVAAVTCAIGACALTGPVDTTVGAELITRTGFETSQQFGTERLDFRLNGYRAMLLKPIRPAPAGARPWIFCAPVFMGPNPQP